MYSGRWVYYDGTRVDLADDGTLVYTVSASWGSSDIYKGGKMNMQLAADQSTVVTTPNATSIYGAPTAPVTVKYTVADDKMNGFTRTSGGPLAVPPPSLGNNTLKVGTYKARIGANQPDSMGYYPPTLTVYPDGTLQWSQYYSPGNQMPSSTSYASATVVVGGTTDQPNLKLTPKNIVISYLVDKDAFVQPNADPTILGFYWIRSSGYYPPQPTPPASIQNTSLRLGKWVFPSSQVYIEIADDGTFSHFTPRNFQTPVVLSGKFDPLVTVDQSIVADTMKVTYVIGSDAIGVNTPNAPWLGYTYATRDPQWLPYVSSTPNTALKPGRWVGTAPQAPVVAGPYSDMVLDWNGSLTFTVRKTQADNTTTETAIKINGFKVKSANDQTIKKDQYTINYIVALDMFAVVDSNVFLTAGIDVTWYFQRDKTFYVPPEPVTLQSIITAITSSPYFIPVVAGVGGCVVLILLTLLIRHAIKMQRIRQAEEEAEEEADEDENDDEDDTN
jgi:hypothetical protein